MAYRSQNQIIFYTLDIETANPDQSNCQIGIGLSKIGSWLEHRRYISILRTISISGLSKSIGSPQSHKIIKWKHIPFKTSLLKFLP